MINTNNIEIWKDIINYESIYQISNFIINNKRGIKKYG